MSPSLQEFLIVDLAAILTATICSLSCALVGSFLILRKQAMLGDAIAHSVLPGLAVAFLVSGSRVGLPMFLGAMAAGVLSALASEALRRIARVDPGAAMGVAFSAMFALGVLLMSLPQMRRVDLDADCVLNGVLESISWTPDASIGSRVPTSLTDLLSPAVLAGAPRQLTTAFIVLIVTVTVLVVLFKELRLATFDPALAAALGFKPGLINMLLIALVAASSVAAFEAVGSILVIAMLICPAAAARMLTDSLKRQLILSGALAALTSVTGYLIASFGPRFLHVPFADSVSASGMIAVVSGLVLVLAIFLSPSHGVIAGRARRLALNLTILREDLLALLYRVEEQRSPQSGPGLAISHILGALGPSFVTRLALRRALSRGEISVASKTACLTDRGRGVATSLVRTHRLWESYLVRELGLRPDHVHRTAMDLEHLTTPTMQSTLRTEATPGGDVPKDPHGRVIP